jgi:hypothetical protein
MIRHLEKRLRKLESKLPPLPDADECHTDGVLWFAVAYYLGNPSPDEEPFAAFARALRYENESQLNGALDDIADPNTSFSVRHEFHLAQAKLLSKFGVDLRDPDSNKLFEALFEALKRMEQGLPKSYKKRLKTILARTDINLRWLRETDLALYIRCFA